MLAFKPKEEPFLTKLFKSGLFQFLMVVLLGVGVTWFVIRSDRPQQWIQRINRFASVSPNPSSNLSTQSATSAQNTEAGIAADAADLDAPPAQANAWSARSASPTETTMNGEVGTIATAPASLTRIASGTAKLKIQMVEIDHDYLDTLTGDRNGQVSAVSDDIQSFRSYPDLIVNSSYITVLKTDTIEFNKDKKDASVTAGNNTRGFVLTFKSLDDLPDATARFFDVYFNKNHPNDAQQLRFEMFIAAREKYIISGAGLISYFETESNLANVSPFQIFKSPTFTNQKTTFAIIVELQ